jgi:hypothetical protein
MDQGAAPPQPPAAPPDDDAQVATLADLRSLRRWLLVAGVWALAATAIAVIALIKAANEGASESRADVAHQIGDAERALDHRIDTLRSRIDALPSSQDLSRVERRLGHAEDNVRKASNDARTDSTKVDNLSKRVDALEKRQTSTTPSKTGK